MKQRIFTLIALFCLATGLTYAQNELVLFEESFDKFSGQGFGDGKVDHFTTGILGATPTNPKFNTALTENNGWTLSGDALQANKSASLFTTLISSASITTPAIKGGQNRPAILTFAAGGCIGSLGEWVGTKAGITVQLNGTDLKTVYFNQHESTFVTINISKLPENAKITFVGTQLLDKRTTYIDEVKVVTSCETLDEAQDNTATINANKGKNVNVQLKRTLTNEHWNTFCVPFDITEAEAKRVLGNNALIREFARMDGATMVFTAVSEIKAGVPVLVKPSLTTNDPIFTNVTFPADIDADGCETMISGYGYKGKYSPYEMATDKTEQFLGDQNYLWVPEAGKNTMKGLRAFFYIPQGSEESQAKVSIEGDEITGIGYIGAEAAPKAGTGAYSINGAYMGSDVKKLGRGLYIVNGKKVLVK